MALHIEEGRFRIEVSSAPSLHGWRSMAVAYEVGGSNAFGPLQSELFPSREDAESAALALIREKIAARGAAPQ
ncbi:MULTISPECIES: hypothetical protein [Xanthomonas]|uniref:hypothetical protein n=1 Tax=Xanthomonas TaxID=338 RepID=UPI000CED861B|nr:MULTISPECIES: hypothetical protein [Xanthomonas]PPT33331.1 hypothetical protein XaCFBP7622_01280 [Xanthomonas arboricola]